MRDSSTLITDGDPSPDPRASQLVRLWELMRQQGSVISPEELCREYPELIEHVRRQINALATLPPIPATTVDEPLLPVIAGYEILREMGRGGMGVVYKARHLALNRLVALKMLLTGPLAAPAERLRFRTEAEAVARLRHTNVVQIHDVGESAGRPFFTMELLEGGSLADRLKGGGPMPPRDAARLIEQLAESMAHAHQRGILHRDLKPANVLFTKDGEPRVTDFGLAKLLDQEGETRTGTVLGTPHYMAPEQASGTLRDVGPAADIWSLGAILYECLTGKPPVRGVTAGEALDHLLGLEAMPPSSLRRGVPRDLETVCLKCLRRDPAARYRAASELADDLGRFRRGEAVRARPPRPAERAWRWARRNRAVAALLATIAWLLFLGAVGGVLWAWRERDLRWAAEGAAKDARNERRRVAHMLERQYVAKAVGLMDARDSFASLPWVGEALRLAGGDPQREEMHRRRMAGVLRFTPRVVHAWEHDAPVRRAVFSPDGSRAATAADDWTARVWDPSSGVPVTPPLRHRGPLQHIEFSPDGGRLLTTSDTRAAGEARVWDATTGRPVTPWLPHAGPVGHAAFDAEGKRVVTASGDGTVRVWDAASGEPLAGPFNHGEGVKRALFLPGGDEVLAVGGSVIRRWNLATGADTKVGEYDGLIYTAALGGDRLAAGGAGKEWFGVGVWSLGEKPPARMMKMLLMGNALHLAFSRDGQRLAAASHDQTVRIVDLAKREALRRLSGHKGSVGHVEFAAGDFVVTASVDRTARVWRWRADDFVPHVLRHGGAVRQSSASADVRRVLTASDDGFARLWELGGRERRFPGDGRNHVMAAAFSPDGKRLAAASMDGMVRVHDLAGDASPLELPHDAAEGRRGVPHVAFSPDGRHLVSGCTDGAAWLWDAATGKLLHRYEIVGSHVEIAVEFSPDGKRFAAVNKYQRGEPRPLILCDVATGKSAPLPGNTRLCTQASFSPDGTRLAACHGEFTAVYDTDTGKEIHRFKLTTGAGGRGKFSPDGNYLVLYGVGEAGVWDVATGRRVGVPMKVQGHVSGAAFSPRDKNRLVTIGEDGAARLWDVQTGKPLAAPMQHLGRMFHLAFSPDGRFLATASEKSGARVWDADTGEPVGPWLHQLPFECWVNHVAFSPDGALLATAGGDSTARVWDLSPDARPREELDRIIEVLSGQQRLGDELSVTLGVDQFREGWAELAKKYPDEFPTRSAADPALAARRHHRRGRSHSITSDWAAAVAEYNRAEELGLADPNLYAERAYARSAMKRWDLARADLDRVAASGADDPDHPGVDGWFYHGCALLLAGKREEHGRLVAKLLRRPSFARDGTAASLTAWVALLDPNAADALAAPTLRAENAVAAAPGNALCHLALALARYRAGKIAEAAEEARAALKLLGGKGEERAASLWLLLAMAEQRQGQSAPAREWLEKASRWLDGDRPAKVVDSSEIYVMAARLLRREAEALVGR